MRFFSFIVGVCCIISCSDTDTTITTDDNDDVVILPEDPDVITLPDTIVLPAIGASFDWQLDDVTSSNEFDATVIDVDAFSTSAATVQHFKDQGKIVIAYLSVGSVENFRPDANQFPAAVIGNVYDGFEDENWLDIRNIDALAPILRARFDMIQAKGFDGIEPDNMNGYQNNTGFSLTQTDAIVFSRWLINEAHARNLHIGQKNAEELVPNMVDEFDWMLTEDAYADNFQDEALPYIIAGKAVFVTEYKDAMSQSQFLNTVCPDAAVNQYSAIYKNRDLTDPVISCN